MSVLRISEDRNRSIEQRQPLFDLWWRYFSQLCHCHTSALFVPRRQPMLTRVLISQECHTAHVFR
eukprot:175623-Pyramimonas_sp.AAC.1